jgi:hypothetical protein
MSNDIIKKTIEEVIQDLADLSYTVLDVKEDIDTGESYIEDTLKKVKTIYEGLIYNQDKLIILNDRDETEGHTIQ